MSDSYYVISRTCPDHGHVYLVGTPSFHRWNADEGRQFKSIGEIRKFITAALQYKLRLHYNNVPVAEWQYEHVTHRLIPASDVITDVHTMGLLRGGVK
jgi:hypothetical protein